MKGALEIIEIGSRRAPPNAIFVKFFILMHASTNVICILTEFAGAE